MGTCHAECSVARLDPRVSAGDYLEALELRTGSYDLPGAASALQPYVASLDTDCVLAIHVQGFHDMDQRLRCLPPVPNSWSISAYAERTDVDPGDDSAMGRLFNRLSGPLYEKCPRKSLYAELPLYQAWSLQGRTFCPAHERVFPDSLGSLCDESSSHTSSSAI